MNSRRPYSFINLTSLLDVVFITLFMVVLSVGASYQAANDEFGRQASAAVAAMTAAIDDAQATAASSQAETVATLAAQAAHNRATTEAHVSNLHVTLTAVGMQAQQQATSAAVTLSVAETRSAGLMATAVAAGQAQTAAARRLDAQLAAGATSMALLQATAAAAPATMTAVERSAQARTTAADATVTALLSAQATAAPAMLTAAVATPAAQAIAARATVTAVLRLAQEEAAVGATLVAQASTSVLAAEATARAAVATADARSDAAVAAEAIAATTQAEALSASTTAVAIYDDAQHLYREAVQILADEAEDPGITLAKARWIDKYGNYYLIRLSPLVDNRSTVDVLRNDRPLASGQVLNEAQIRDLLTILDRSDVADTLVILKFSRNSSDNHREWILRYLDSYNFKYQRIQEEIE